MTIQWHRLGIAAILGLAATAAVFGQAPSIADTPKVPAAPAGQEVTLTANIMSYAATGEKGKVLFLIAYDGTPEVKAEFEKILADYPDKGLDADAAVKVQDQFMTRLRYNIDIEASGDVAAKLLREAANSVRQAQLVTGKVEEREGKKWITLRSAKPTNFKFPDKMMAPDKPFVMPDKEPLVLKVSDTLTYKCIYVPPGKFLMGEPYWQCRHWQEDPPHVVTLTKGFYMAEHPVTQEIYEAVMGNNPAKEQDTKLPISNVDCANMYKFCELLGEQTKQTIRVPTAAEWEYAARVGTSNPTFAVKYADQNSNANATYGTGPLAVKSRKANPWGFYDMHSGWWERVSDAPVPQRKDEVDPVHLPPQDKLPETRGNKHGHFGKGQWTYEISEVEFISSQAGPYRFRIVVEAGATPAKAADK